MILVDFQCGTCGGRFERLVTSPPPAEVPCAACRLPARRMFSPVGLVGAAVPPSTAPPPAPTCRDNPDVPGLCHMTPSAARAWVARARRDNRGLERELARQERALAETGAPGAEPVHHDHGHGGGHAHDHAHGSAHSHDHATVGGTTR